MHHLSRHAVTCGDDCKIHQVIMHSRGRLQVSGVNSVDDRTREPKRHATASPVGSSRPACVHEPDIGFMTTNLFRQQFRIHARMPHKERSTKTWGERGLWLRNTNFCTSDFRCITADEEIHGLLGRQSGDRRQHSKSITGQKNNIRGMTGHAGDLCVSHELDGVSSSSILCDRGVIKIDMVMGSVINDILQHRSESQGFKNLRF